LISSGEKNSKFLTSTTHWWTAIYSRRKCKL